MTNMKGLVMVIFFASLDSSSLFVSGGNFNSSLSFSNGLLVKVRQWGAGVADTSLMTIMSVSGLKKCLMEVRKKKNTQEKESNFMVEKSYLQMW